MAEGAAPAVSFSDTPATPNTQEITALATAIAGNVFEKVGVLRERDLPRDRNSGVS